MLIIRDPADVKLILEPSIRALVQERFCYLLAEYEAPYRPELHGWFAVLEGRDSPEAYQVFVADWEGHLPDEDAYSSPFECCENHAESYELVRVLADCGEAVALYVPKTLPDDDALIQLCRTLSCE